MKFNKLILGLAAFPLLLVSCNHQFTFEEVKEWVSAHYKEENPQKAVAILEWDYHATVGDDALKLVESVFGKLEKEGQGQGLPSGIIKFPGKEAGTIGHLIKTDETYEIPVLNAEKFGNEHWGKQKKDGTYNETFKILGNALSATFACDLTPTDHKPIEDTSNIFTYNDKGWCTGYGFKIGRYFINSDNIVKMKITLKFLYENDPII